MVRLLVLFAASALAVFWINTTTWVNVNNRFVAYILVLCAILFCLILFYIKQQKLLRNLLLSIVIMAGFAFMLVPLYNVFCDITGLNGKLDLNTKAATSKGVDYSRTITVEFVVSHNHEMPWLFKPQHQVLKVHPGELVATAYYAKNTSTHTMVAQAIPSITPSIASKYFKKVECFCFSSQKLGSGESANLGLRFYLDPSLPKDVQRVTLAYTIFDITSVINTQEYKHE